MAESRDWTRSQFEACPECGVDATALDDDALGSRLIAEVAAWGRTLAAADPVAVRRHADGTAWSALEYAAHVRDVIAVMDGRIGRMLAERDPALDWWDHEAAAVDERYNDQVPVLVQESMTANARALAATLARVDGDGWERTGTRRGTEPFTVRGMGRFVIHEVIHHREDAERVLRALVPTEGPPAS